MGQPGFIHLRGRSAYSLLEGAIPLKRLIDLAVEDGQPALGLADNANLFGALEFSEVAASKGVQPIIGVELPLFFNVDEDDRAQNLYHSGLQESGNGAAQSPLQSRSSGQSQSFGQSRAFGSSHGQICLYAASKTGYENLVQLVSRAYLDGSATTKPSIYEEWLGGETSEGLLALSGGFKGPIDLALRDENPDKAQDYLNRLLHIFDDRFYLEVQRHGQSFEHQVEPQLVDLAYEKAVPLIATNDIHFAEKSDFEAHDALLAVADGAVIAQDDRRHLTLEFYFKTRAEMMDLFADLPEALVQSVEFAQRIHARPMTHAPILPRFSEGQPLAKNTDIPENTDASENVDTPENTDASENVHVIENAHVLENVDVPEKAESEADILRAQAYHGLEMRLEKYGLAPGYSREDYQARLEMELDVIIGMEFPGYFLIVADFIKWAKEHDIPVGPGRGSGAGSLVAYVLTITDLDPLRYSLLFERFLNAERVSMPDFDIDFCQDRRDEVITYVQEKYGFDQVAQIITFGSLQARAVLRDVGRVLQMPYGQVDRICKLIPSNPANPVSLSQAIEDEPQLQMMQEEEDVVRQLLAIGQKLEGLYRHASTHAAGVVIGDRPLSQLVPLYSDPRSEMPVTQFNLKWVEQAGLVKFDFLGLKTLTVIDQASKFIRRHQPNFDIETVSLTDEKTFQLYQDANTVGVFQVESAGMRSMLLDLKPDVFEDIIALVALYRPGPMSNIPSFCARKHGREQPDYLHALLEPILKETYGIIVYQEQVMEIAQVLGGYSLGGADILRRAMGKKIKSVMDENRDIFVKGAVGKGVGEGEASHIYDLVAKFADYGFNKSHAAGYALVSYQTAYIKAHFPVEFLASSMALDMGNTDKLNDFHQDASSMGIEVVPPCVQRSMASFDVEDGCILYALAAIKGVGRQVADHIVEMRGDEPFASLADFSARMDVKFLNRRTLEKLVFAGAFDALEPDRARAFAAIEPMIQVAQREANKQQNGFMDMFDGVEQQAPPLPMPNVDPWLPQENSIKSSLPLGFI